MADAQELADKLDAIAAKLDELNENLWAYKVLRTLYPDAKHEATGAPFRALLWEILHENGSPMHVGLLAKILDRHEHNIEVHLCNAEKDGWVVRAGRGKFAAVDVRPLGKQERKRLAKISRLTRIIEVLEQEGKPLYVQDLVVRLGEEYDLVQASISRAARLGRVKRMGWGVVAPITYVGESLPPATRTGRIKGFLPEATLNLLRVRGRLTSKDLAIEAKCSLGYASTTLANLALQGLAVRVARGVYQHAGDYKNGEAEKTE